MDYDAESDRIAAEDAALDKKIAQLKAEQQAHWDESIDAIRVASVEKLKLMGQRELLERLQSH